MKNGPLPLLDEDNRVFWQAGRDGVLRFSACRECGALLHPVQPICRYCWSRDLEVRDVPATGVIVGCTVNHQPWIDALPPPYVIANVAIDADPRVRVQANIIGLPPESVDVGMRVVAEFEQVEDVWIPRFRPTGERVEALPDDPIGPRDHRRFIRPLVGTHRYEDDTAITGIGRSAIGRRLLRNPLSLTIDAIIDAAADAGLQLSDIDGLSTYPGAPAGAGFAEGGITAVEDALGLQPTWYNGGVETFGPVGSLVSAMHAISAGLVRHVVCFRTVWQATYAAEQRALNPSGPNPYGTATQDHRVGPGLASYTVPAGIGSAANTLAMIASNHFRRYGTTRETLGWIALNQRRNAGLNPDAIYREPLTMDDYLSARLISTPFGLYDCDVPVDASIAVVLSRRDAAKDMRQAPVLFEATGTAMTERTVSYQSTMSHEPQVLGPCAHLWSRTGLGPSDVDVALLYDGFTFNCLSWLEGLGFCAIGEARDFLDGGANIALHGTIPVNPHGGQLSAGRTHGMGLLHEAVLQLRGQAGARQVPDATIAAVCSGGLSPAGVFLLRAG